MEYGALDIFRLIAAFLIVAIHTGPFAGVSETAEQCFTYGACRIAVPFFLMVSGYFVLSGFDCEDGRRRIFRTVKKLSVLYVAATVFYLPVSFYSGRLPKISGIFKWFVFDGSFYHLWYLPGAVLGMLLAYVLLKKGNLHTPGIIASQHYLLGLFGDRYYGAASMAQPVKTFYECIFSVSAYTRNGIFFVPLFLILGASVAKYETSLTAPGAFLGFFAALSAMMFEGVMTESLGWQRHDSMYLFLPLTVFFLFEALLRVRVSGKSGLRRISMWIYLLHPICILFVRALLKAVRLGRVITTYTFLYYLFVCAVSFVFAFLLDVLLKNAGKKLSVKRISGGD